MKKQEQKVILKELKRARKKKNSEPHYLDWLFLQLGKTL